MLKRIPVDDPRPVEQIREHYEIEKELADRLRLSSRAERRQMYGRVYDELFRRVPHHSQLTRKADPQGTRQCTQGSSFRARARRVATLASA